MKVQGLDGRTYVWTLTDLTINGIDNIERSTPHLLARKLLREMYPLERLLEEISLPGSGGLTADFYIHTQHLMVEVHGEQHYKFIPFFHTDRWGFIASQKRDERKRVWSELNNIQLVELPHDTGLEDWRERIVNR